MRKLAALLLGIGIALAPFALAQETAKEGSTEKKGGITKPPEIFEWANFAILAGLLGYMAVKQGGPFFNSRAAEIRKGIDEAEKIKADSNAKIAAINSKLGRLDAEIVSMRETAATERRAAEQRLKSETQLEIERIRSHAEDEIETAGKSERVSLQRYVAQLALSLAETKVKARMSPSTGDALVNTFIKGLGAAPARTQPTN
jgi:F0F1-type ATP synthase membrane subunit b/b'